MESRTARFEQYVNETAEPDLALLMGCIRVYQATGNALLRDYAVKHAKAGMPLLFALDVTGEERIRQAAVEQAAQDMNVQRLEEAFALLPFRMGYEMKLNRMAWVSRVAEQFKGLRTRLYDAEAGLYCASAGEGFTPVSTGWYLAALVDSIEACDQQLYEHWRALVDIFRECLRGLLRFGNTAGAESLAVYAIRKAVRMGIIDPERYLPAAEKLETTMDESAGMSAYMMAWAECLMAEGR